MNQYTLLPLVLMLAFGGYFAWMMSKRSKMLASFGPKMRGFFEQTGYRYAHLPPEPLDAHVKQAHDEATRWSGDRVTHYVRSFHGMPVHFKQSVVGTDRGTAISCTWNVPLHRPARIPFHVADRSLSSVGSAVKAAFTNMSRSWRPRFPGAVTIGIPQIDERFVIYGHDPNAVRWLFQQNPALVQALLSCVEVDLWVDAGEATFSDPFQKNLHAAYGGTVGAMAVGFDMTKSIDIMIPVHERMSELLSLAVRAAQ